MRSPPPQPSPSEGEGALSQWHCPGGGGEGGGTSRTAGLSLPDLQAAIGLLGPAEQAGLVLGPPHLKSPAAVGASDQVVLVAPEAGQPRAVGRPWLGLQAGRGARFLWTG